MDRCNEMINEELHEGEEEGENGRRKIKDSDIDSPEKANSVPLSNFDGEELFDTELVIRTTDNIIGPYPSFSLTNYDH